MPQQLAARHPRKVLAVLLLACSACSLAQTLVIPALPALGEHVGASPSAASWLLSGFLLSAAVATPLAGTLGDIYRKGRVLAVLMVLFSIGCIICALSSSIGPLLAGRVLQGVAGGVFPLAFGIVRDTFPPRLIPGGLSIVSALLGIGGGLGLSLSGVIADHLGTAWLFWSCLAMSVPAAAAALLLIPPYRAAAHARVDWLGALLLSVALVAILLAVTEANDWGWTSPKTIGAALGGFAVLGVRSIVKGNARAPLAGLDAACRRAIAATNVAGFCIGFAMFASFLLVPQLGVASEVGGLDLSVTEVGLLVLPAPIAQVVVGPLAGRLGARIGFRLVLVAGGAACVVALALLMVQHDHIMDFLVSGALVGVGIALSYAAMANILVEVVSQGEVGIVTGVNTVARMVGGALGAAVVTAIVAAGDGPADVAYAVAFGVAAAAGIVAMLVTLLIPSDRPALGERIPEPPAASVVDSC